MRTCAHYRATYLAHARTHNIFTTVLTFVTEMALIVLVCLPGLILTVLIFLAALALTVLMFGTELALTVLILYAHHARPPTCTVMHTHTHSHRRL